MYAKRFNSKDVENETTRLCRASTVHPEPCKWRIPLVPPAFRSASEPLDVIESAGSRMLSMSREIMIDDIIFVKVVVIPRVYGPPKMKERIFDMFERIINPKYIEPRAH